MFEMTLADIKIALADQVLECAMLRKQIAALQAANAKLSQALAKQLAPAAETDESQPNP